MAVTSLPDILVEFTADGSRLWLRFPYNPTLISLVKALPDRRYHVELKRWSIPARALAELQAMAARSGVELALAAEVLAAVTAGAEDKAALRQLLDDRPLALPTATNLYPYQRAGVRWLTAALAAFKGALLCDDMGTGKTLQALSVVALAPRLQRVLIVCPASLKYVWAAEIDKHYPEFSYVVIAGGPQERDGLWRQAARLKIVNYESLLRDQYPFLIEWDMVIGDEVTFAKSWAAQRSKRLKRLPRRYSLGLSGMPVENRLEELHSVMDFCMPELLGTPWRFVAEHCVKNQWGSVVGYRRVDAVRQRIAPHYLRRLKSEVLAELPPKVYTDYPVQLGRAERAAYEGCRLQIKTFIQENPHLRVANILTEMLRLKQIADDLGLLDEDYTAESTKTAALRQIMEAAEGHSVVAFTQFAQFARRLGQRLAAPVYYGGLALPERQRLTEEFQAGGHPLLLSTDAGAYGVTLTRADIVVMLDLPWNPARLRQREDRLHRIGQAASVQVVTLLARDTIDEYVRRIIHRKRALAAQIFTGEEPDDVEDTAVTRADLLGLLGERQD